MKTKVFLVAMLCTLLFSACEKSELITTPSSATELQTRERQPKMVVTITKTDGSTLNATVSLASANYVSAYYFTATLNPGTNDAQSFNATAMTFSETDNNLSITKSINGVGMVYSDKASASVTIGYGVLNLSIEPGTINTTATSIVGEETDGL